MKKTLALLLLVPMLSFMVIPVATVSAHFYNTTVYVGCGADYGSSSSSVVRIDGYRIAVYCPPGSEYEYFTCLYLPKTVPYTATMTSDINVLKHTGTFGPHSGSVGGEMESSFGDAGAMWGINSGCID